MNENLRNVFDEKDILAILILIGVSIGGLISLYLNVNDIINSITMLIFTVVLFYRLLIKKGRGKFGYFEISR